LPPMLDRIIPDSQNVAWDDLGPRTCKGVVLHRQLGGNWGTDGWFRLMWQPNGEPGGGQLGLTDIGIDSVTGEILVWNDCLGAGKATGKAASHVSPNRSGYASGRVSKPYGDGLAFVNKYGIDAVNRDQRSIEIDRYYASEVKEVALQRIAQVIAHDAHDYGIPWDVFPTAPQDGFSFVRWHQEYTIGTGKVCPGDAVLAITDDLIGRAKAIMKRYQTEKVAPEPVEPSKPAPQVIYASFDRHATFTAVAGAVGRQYAARDAPARKRYAEGDEIVAAGFYFGEEVSGDTRWLMTMGNGQLRVHVSGVREDVPKVPGID
ncbi:MAG: hypothetical protein M3R06_03165, partial [Chloroflexota bacterium]|nr:hypothetical protein [Chloroflexota bacterium]